MHDPGGRMVEVARLLAAARTVAVLTGAGVSAESGVPTFRGPGDLWRSFRPEQLATPEAFARDPVLVWEWYRWRRSRVAAARPNPGHVALARLEGRVPALTVVTQNVDGLHARAGSRRLIELHGNIWRDRCTNDPGHVFWRTPGEPAADVDGMPLCACGAPLRPDVVWFGEPLDPDRLQAAFDAAREAELLLVVGTSSIVHPAAALPAITREAGGSVVEVNPEETPLSDDADAVLRGAAGEILPALERLAFG